ncbi:MAG: GAF domain-containing protein [Hyphomonadaceae bacterium]|nr:GAF domain-containing protein [Hyphomonadaceae bacterium]
MAEATRAPLPEDKAQRYAALRAEIAAVIAGEPSRIARYASAASLLAQAFPDRFFWTGFYLVDEAKRNELVVGPYQGTLGCLRIPFGKGVCGAAAQACATIIVPDVHAFPGHIACDSRSNSEIVTPVFDRSGVLAAVLDVDSTQFNAFDETDQAGLEAICADLLTLD